jgi:hypothetical protein
MLAGWRLAAACSLSPAATIDRNKKHTLGRALHALRPAPPPQRWRR